MIIVIFGSGFFLGDIILDIPGLNFLFLGVIVMAIGVTFYYLLFSPERIKGFQAEYEASPDLSSFKVVKSFSKDKIKQSRSIPEIAYCSKCGKKIYRPFSCAKCNQLLCGEHYLQGTHDCIE